MPLFTVGVPTYNRAGMLAQTLDCILQQTFRDFEVVVSDNASTDDTPQVVARYVGRRFRYFRQETNVGSLLNFRFLGDVAAGEWLVIHQDDDLLSPLFLERCAHAIGRCPELVMYGTEVAYKRNGDEKRLYDTTIHGFPILHGWDQPQPRLIPGDRIAALTLFETGLIPPAQAIRTDLYRLHYPRDSAMTAFADRYLNGRVALEGVVAYEGMIGAIVRNHVGRYTSQTSYDPLEAARKNTVLLLEHFAARGLDWRTACRAILPEVWPGARRHWLHLHACDPTIPPEALEMLAEDFAREEGVSPRAYVDRLRAACLRPVRGRLDRLPLPQPVINRIRALRRRLQDALAHRH